MGTHPGELTRREMLGVSGALLGAAALPGFGLDMAQTPGMQTGPKLGIGYFAKFGVTEELIRKTLGEALSKGGDYADIYFQHQISNTLGLEDGVVNRA